MEGAIASAPASATAPANAGNSEATEASDTGAEPAQATQAAQANDDPEYDLGGEKLKRSEYKRLRDLEAKRKEYDRAASLRFEEASKKEKAAASQSEQVKALVADFSKDTKAKLRALGIDPLKFAEETLAAELEEGSLSDEQRELRDLKADKQRREAEQAEADKANEAKTAATQLDQLTDAVMHDFFKVLEPRNLPEKARAAVLKRMASDVEALLDQGVPFDLADVADDAIADYRGRPADQFSGLTPEQAVEQYPEIAELFRKGLLSKTNKPQTPQPPSNPQRPGSKRSHERGHSIAEMQARIDKRLEA